MLKIESTKMVDNICQRNPKNLLVEPGFRVYTIPKSGTFLFKKLLNNLLIPCVHAQHIHEEQNQLFAYRFFPHTVQHVLLDKNLFHKTTDLETYLFIQSKVYQPGYENKKFKTVILFRDIRDNFISMQKYILKRVQDKQANGTATAEELNRLDKWKKIPINQRIQDCLNIKPTIFDYKFWNLHKFRYLETAEKFKKLKNKNIHFIKFEDLVGEAAGGASRSRQFEVIQKMCNFIGFPRTTKEINFAIDHLWGDSATFTQDSKKVGVWKDVLDAQSIDLFKAKYGKLLIDMEYEKDLNW